MEQKIGILINFLAILPGFCPLLKPHFGHEKPSIYAGLRAFCPLSHFFLKTIMIKKLIYIINMANKSGFLTKLIYGGVFDEYKAKRDMERYF